jgi:hypothetical protein
MSPTIKDLQQNLVGPSAESLVMNREIPPNLMRTRRLQAKWHEAKRLLCIARYLTPHNKTKVMRSCQLGPHRCPAAHVARHGK